MVKVFMNVGCSRTSIKKSLSPCHLLQLTPAPGAAAAMGPTCPPHSTPSLPVMSEAAGYHRRGFAIGAKIFDLFSFGPSTYDETSPMIEYWIEYALTEQSLDVDDLVEQVSPWVWVSRNSEFDAAAATFLKEFRDAPHRSEKARSFVDMLCAFLCGLRRRQRKTPTRGRGRMPGRLGSMEGGA